MSNQESDKKIKTMVYRQIGGFMSGLSDDKEIESRDPESIDLVFRYTLTPRTRDDEAPVVEEEVDFFYFYDIDENGKTVNKSGRYYVRGKKLDPTGALEEVEKLRKSGIIDEYTYERGINRIKALAEKGCQYFIVQEPSKEKKKSFDIIDATEEDQTLDDISRMQNKGKAM